jgi:hypothetical protein
LLKYTKLPLTFDPAFLQADLQQVAPDEWQAHFNSRYYEGDWSGVSLRALGGNAAQLYPDPTAKEFADTPLLARCANLREALAAFHCSMQSVRLLKVSPGSRILEHKDHNLSLDDGEIRLHVPITTNPEVEFFVDGEQVAMQAGECWYINFNLPHRVANLGATNRIHLVMDCVVNDWLRALIPNPGAATEATIASQSSPESLERFCQLVLKDVELQTRLRLLTDKQVFIRLVVQLGSERGYFFCGEDVAEALRSSRRAWFQQQG